MIKINYVYIFLSAQSHTLIIRATIYKKGQSQKFTILNTIFSYFFFLKPNSSRSQKINFRPNGVELTELYSVKQPIFRPPKPRI